MSDYVLAVDLGGTNTKVGLISEFGETIFEEWVATKEFVRITQFIDRLEKIIERVSRDLQESDSLLGVGVAAPSVSKSGQFRAPANLNWDEVNLKDLMRERLDLPTLVVNDANAAAYGELKFGIARKMRNFATVTLGTGVGCGLVIDGKIVDGRNGFAGEFGHITAVPQGRRCGCGKRGCLETYVSATGLCRTARELQAREGIPTRLADYTDQQLTARLIWQHAQNGDRLARMVFQFTGEVLGRSLADLATLLDPEAIILFGGVMKAGQLLLEPTKKEFRKNLLPFQRDSVPLLATAIESDKAALLGISALVLESRQTVLETE